MLIQKKKFCLVHKFLVENLILAQNLNIAFRFKTQHYLHIIIVLYFWQLLATRKESVMFLCCFKMFYLHSPHLASKQLVTKYWVSLDQLIWSALLKLMHNFMSESMLVFINITVLLVLFFCWVILCHCCWSLINLKLQYWANWYLIWENMACFWPTLYLSYLEILCYSTIWKISQLLILEWIYLNVFTKGYICVEWLNIFGAKIFDWVFCFYLIFCMWGFNLRVSDILNLNKIQFSVMLKSSELIEVLSFRIQIFIFLSCFHFVCICSWWNFEVVASI